MSHVDEGALHAYLDGALDEYSVAEARGIREHLDACASCAERLEVERGLRSDAHAMLGMAAPNVDLPSFEELRAYVERTRPTPSRESRRITRLSWAASVMLALGIGWMLRGGRLEPLVDSNNPSPVALAEQAGARMGREGPREGSPTSVADASGERVRPMEAGPTETIRRDAFESRTDLRSSVVATSSAGEDRADVSVSVAAEPAAAVSSVAADVDERAIDQSVSTEVLAAERFDAEALMTPAEQQTEPGVRQVMFDDVATGGSAGVDAVVGATDDTVPPRLVEADVVALEEPADAVDEDESRPERRRAESPTAFTSQFSAGRGSVRVVPEDDDRFDDEPLQSVPGFEVVASDNIGDGTVFLGTVATQRLEGEQMMQVFLLEPEVELDVLPVLDPSVNEVRVQAETGWVVLRGPRSEDELETLLMRLFPS